MPDFLALPSPLVAALPLLLMGLGLLAMLLPAAFLREIAGGRDPVAVAMLPFSLGLALLGLLLAALNAADGVRAHLAWQWQPVPARVVSSGLIETMQPRSTTPAWRPDVRYAYRFGGQTHTGDRIASRSLASSDRAGTADWLQRHYPAGAEVTAYVDPGHPGRAVLERGGSPWTWWVAGAGLAMMGAGLWLLRIAIDTARPEPPPRKRKRRRSQSGEE